MRVIVTGGAGFIGSHLIEALIEQGDEVTCVEREGAGARWIAALPVRFVASGIHDEAVLRPLLAGADVVYHLAGLTEAATPAAFYRVNTLGTATILRAAQAQRNPPRVILLSSIAATGPCRNGERLDPWSVPFPLSHYGQSKLLAEAAVHAYADQVPATILRFPSVYGPRERALLKVFRLVRRGVALTIGSWDREASLLYVRDAVTAIIAAATTERAVGRTYCLAHPEPVTWRRFAGAVGAALQRHPRLISVPAPVARAIAVAAETVARVRRRAAILNRERVREIMQRRWVLDPSLALHELSLQPAYPLARGVVETASWYRKEGWL